MRHWLYMGFKAVVLLYISVVVVWTCLAIALGI
jgi:hypothetical protein